MNPDLALDASLSRAYSRGCKTLSQLPGLLRRYEPRHLRAVAGNSRKHKAQRLTSLKGV
jgi:hypothetical protein